MALKDTWVDKTDGVDINSANDINEVAHAVIDLEGKTAYDYAKEGGYEGTEEEFAKMLANGNSLPEVSAEDNGKILQVVDGAYQLVVPIYTYDGTVRDGQSFALRDTEGTTITDSNGLKLITLEE